MWPRDTKDENSKGKINRKYWSWECSNCSSLCREQGANLELGSGKHWAHNQVSPLFLSCCSEKFSAHFTNQYRMDNPAHCYLCEAASGPSPLCLGQFWFMNTKAATGSRFHVIALKAADRPTWDRFCCSNESMPRREVRAQQEYLTRSWLRNISENRNRPKTLKVKTKLYPAFVAYIMGRAVFHMS